MGSYGTQINALEEILQQLAQISGVPVPAEEEAIPVTPEASGAVDEATPTRPRPDRRGDRLMALSATLYNLTIDLSDVDRGVYEALELHVARQPSETAEYMTVRVLAYCLEYVEGIELTQGVAAGGEPALYVRDLTGQVQAWIEVGLPDAERIHRAAAPPNGWRSIPTAAWSSFSINWQAKRFTAPRQSRFTPLPAVLSRNWRR